MGTVLEGSVRKAGNRLRITAQLISVADGYHLWSERYDREMTDVFEIQDEISQAIVDALRVRLGGQTKHLLKRYTENLEAYNCYLLGRYHWHKLTGEGMAKSKECFEAAIRHDPHYALPYTGLAEAYGILGWFGIILPREAGDAAKQAVSRALELDEEVAESHAVFGAALSVFDRNWVAAEREFDRALQLNRESPSTLDFYAMHFLRPMGRLDEALAEMQRVLELAAYRRT